MYGMSDVLRVAQPSKCLVFRAPIVSCNIIVFKEKTTQYHVPVKSLVWRKEQWPLIIFPSHKWWGELLELRKWWRKWVKQSCRKWAAAKRTQHSIVQLYTKATALFNVTVNSSLVFCSDQTSFISKHFSDGSSHLPSNSLSKTKTAACHCQPISKKASSQKDRDGCCPQELLDQQELSIPVSSPCFASKGTRWCV